MVSKQSILGDGSVDQISASFEEMKKMIVELKELVMNQTPIANSSSDQHRPPPAPPHPQPQPFYSCEFPPPSLVHQFNTNEFTASQVFDKSSVPTWSYDHSQFQYHSLFPPLNHTQEHWTNHHNLNNAPLYSVDHYYYSQPQPLLPHAPQHPYTLTVQTTLSTGQPYYTIEPTTVFGNVHSIGDLKPIGKSMDVCEADDKLEAANESAVKPGIEEVENLEARVACEVAIESEMNNELGADQKDKSVYEDGGDTCEIDYETETKAEVGCVDEAKNEVETNAKKLLPPLLHLAFQAFDKFISKLGRFPIASTDKNAQKLITIVDILNESGGDAGKVVDINPEFLQQFPFGTHVVLNPLAAIFGGIVGQEVKECLMVATKLQNKLEDAQVFIVGSGASRDPSQKQAPMCVVHSSPHNIDHWLIRARSEFEGLLEKHQLKSIPFFPIQVNILLRW